MALYLYLHFPALLPDSLISDNAQQLPVAIVNSQHVIVQLNTEAARQGVQLQMGLATAAALCPQLQVLPYQSERQQRILTALAQQLYQLSSDIALDLPDGLFLHLSPMLKLYQGLAACWQRLNTALQALPYQYYFACANTPFAAKLLARQQLNRITDESHLIDSAVQRSPLCFSELDTGLQQQLQRLGVVTLGQLLALPAAELARRFEHSLLSYLGRLRGDFYHALDYIQPETGFSCTLELLYDINNTAVLSVPLTSLLQQLQQHLTQRNSLCHQLTLSLFFRGQNPQLLSIGSAQGEYRADNWLKLCQLHLDKLRLKTPVTGLSLKVAQLVPQQVTSDDLFSPQHGTVSSLQLVSILQARLGKGRVSGLMLQNQYWPEHACKPSLPLLQGKAETVPLMLRPAFVLTQPEPLRESVELNSGPERLCVDGWSLSQQRDYFIGRNSRGQWLWLYRTAQQDWFVHGLFS